jgi:hypothetical protein
VRRKTCNGTPAGNRAGPVADIAGPTELSWHDDRPILEDLAEELA